MARFWLFRRSTARYPTVKPAVRNRILEAAEDNGIVVDKERLTGHRPTRTFTHKYEWEIKPGQDTYVVVEREYISVWWYVVFCASFVAGFGAALFVLPPVGTFGGAVILVGLAVCIHAFFRDSPLDATITINEAYRSHPAGRIVTLLLVPLVLVTLLMAALTFTTTPEFWAITFLFVLLLMSLLTFFRYQRSLDRFEPRHVSRFYNLIGGYLLYLVFAVTPASMVIALQSNFFPSPTFHVAEVAVVLGVQMLIIALLYKFVTLNRVFDYHTFLGDEQSATVQNPAYRFPVLAFLTGMTYAVLYILWYVIRNYSGFITLRDPLISIIIVFSIVPVLYIPVGVVLQTASFVAETHRLFTNSEPITVEGDLPVGDDVQIRELKVDNPVAGSFSTGFNDYIFVSESLLRKLDQDELAAVVAHEDGHIHHNDALLSFLIPLIAVLMLTGKNVIYAVLDFHTREYRADQYAVEKTGAEPLRRALQKMSSTEGEDARPVQRRYTAVPTLISIPRTNADNPDSLGFHDRYFGTYFGNFALTEAHPSLDERVRRL